MTYHKRPVQTRKCAHCRTQFECAHKSRLYCCQSCNTLACRARKQASTGNGRAGEARPASGDVRFSAHNVGVVAVGSALGTLAAQGGTYLAQQLIQGGSDLELLRAEVRQLRQALGVASVLPELPAGVAFLPVALRTATAPIVSLAVGGRAVPFVRLSYHGHVLYHHPEQGVVLWEERPGKYHRLRTEQQMTQLAAHPPAPLATAAAPALFPAGEDLFGARFMADMQQAAVKEAASHARMAAAFRLMPAPEPRVADPPVLTAEGEAFRR